ncbi:hypothetical protein ACFPVX_01750 [Cohnella faecalis]|uniref:Endonuclease/exonuclease/phosphatase domain-containing protein n=1 Tax=Cohnella faecalis TaxID=2315694 RepID=A0A398CZW2_9BACL|nr:hypothetical protein [Cohnella faecalis]RIE04741.1 hypothetical protein D3H35_04465 [Cohnella faecalis]
MDNSFMFWNLQRLGASTDAEVVTGITAIASAQQANAEGYCELTTACTAMTPHNITYRKETSHQLCYSARDYAQLPSPIVYPIPTQLALTRIEPESTAAYEQAGYDGGKNFKNLCDRAPAYVGGGLIGGVNVFIFHAPAHADSAERAVAFIACYLQDYYTTNPAPWLLIGDLNVEPKQLAGSKVGISLEDYIISSGQPTHKKGKELDYALTNYPNAIKLKRVHANKRFEYSDHIPIVAVWG